MKRDLMKTNVQPLSGTQNGPRQKPTSKDLNVAEEREQIAGIVRPSGNTRTASETETDKLASALFPHQVREKLMSAKSQVVEAVEYQPQSGRISRYAAADSVCREDPW